MDFHAEMFRRWTESHYFNQDFLAMAFDTTVENVLDRFLMRRDVRVAVEHPDRRGNKVRTHVYDIRLFQYEEKIEYIRSLICFMECEFTPLLVTTSQHVEDMGRIYKHSDPKALRAAIYRSVQFHYARTATINLGVTDYDALTAVAQGFGFNPAILYNIAEHFTFEWQKIYFPSTLLDMEEHIRFLSLLRYMENLTEEERYPEFHALNTVRPDSYRDANCMSALAGTAGA